MLITAILIVIVLLAALAVGIIIDDTSPYIGYDLDWPEELWDRKAFTLLELLVVIAIIGVLVGLLLPAIQRVREAAAVARCQNNLKQIALGLLHHETVTGRLPPACRDFPRQVWWPHLWPFVEQRALYDRYRFDLSWVDGPNPATLRETIPLYSCPSDRPGSVLAGRARGNYVLNVYHPLPLPAGVIAPAWGPFGYVDGRSHSRPRQTRLAEISDGISNTLLVSETNNADVAVDVRGDVLFDSPGAVGFTTERPPNSKFPDQLPACTDATGLPCEVWHWNAVAARSRHANGVNAAMADGSVHYFSDRVDGGVWKAMGSVNGGEGP